MAVNEAWNNLRTGKRLLRDGDRESFLGAVLIAEAMGADHAYCDALRDLADNWEIPIFPVTGHDLLARGLPQGPLIGDVLKELEKWWEDNDYLPTREEMLSALDREIARQAAERTGALERCAR